MNKLLLVEDNQLNREMLSRRLERKGFEVLTASDGQAALQIAADRSPSLILIDMGLPVMDGCATTRQLKLSPATAHIPVIVLTAFAMIGDRERALEAGCDDYVTKPIDLEGLLKKIDRLVPDDTLPEEAFIFALSHAGTPIAPSTGFPSRQGVTKRESFHEEECSLLLVDDDAISRENLLRHFQREGYRVTIASSGREAIDWLECREFDLLVLDVHLPEISGLDIIQGARGTFSLLELPIIAISDNDNPERVVQALQAGANDFVTNSVSFPVLLARVATHLRARRCHFKSLAAPTDHAEEKRTAFNGARKSHHPLPSVRDTDSRSSTRAMNGSSDHGDRFRLSPSHSGVETETITKTTPVAQLGSHNADYEILEELGRGSMGIVYQARDREMDRLVALKIFHRENLPRIAVIESFYREIQTVSRLSHCNIALAYDVGQMEDSHFLATEFVDGMDLQEMVRQQGPLPYHEANHYILQAASGLQHVFEQGMIHRDIKPAHLRLSLDAREPLVSSERMLLPSVREEEATLKILDLGVSRLWEPSINSESSPTRERRALGTADYMAPEQWMNPHTVDIRADLYSLGATYYFLLTGEVPFPGDEPMDKMLKHHLDEPIPIQDLAPSVPTFVVEAIRCMMAKKPDQRPQTPAEVIELLS